MTPHLLAGWPLVGVFAAGLAVEVGAAFVVGGAPAEGFAVAIHWTARSSFVLFTLAFAASSLAALRPTAFTRWLRGNRRSFGVAFALSHIAHAIVIFSGRLHADGTLLGGAPASGLVPGALVYLFIGLMLATSFDHTAARVGPRAWRALHLTGSYAIFAAFALAYGTLVAGGSRVALVPLLVLAAVLALRVARHRRARALADS